MRVSRWLVKQNCTAMPRALIPRPSGPVTSHCHTNCIIMLLYISDWLNISVFLDGDSDIMVLKDGARRIHRARGALCWISAPPESAQISAAQVSPTPMPPQTYNSCYVTTHTEWKSWVCSNMPRRCTGPQRRQGQHCCNLASALWGCNTAHDPAILWRLRYPWPPSLQSQSSFWHAFCPC